MGDFAETIATVLPKADTQHQKSLTSWIQSFKQLKDADDTTKKQTLTDAWMGMTTAERFVFNKLLTGGFRIGVSQKLMVKALSQSTGVEENVLAHRLMGNWSPDTHSFHDLVYAENILDDLSKPYPFYLAYALEGEPDELGEPGDWLAERKWDGIRGQVIFRKENYLFGQEVKSW